ncbi:hypothetical protein, partial [Campylobacter coli]|uniref:hypothetical protein n=1 Tax=Campylobacter coli TaxID=195 RepID=UPI001F096A1E
NKELTNIASSIESSNKTIGQEIDKDEVLKILNKLGFELIISADGHVNVKAPMHRPDIKNLADNCEEV